MRFYIERYNMTAINLNDSFAMLHAWRSITSNFLELSRSDKFPKGDGISTHGINLTIKWSNFIRIILFRFLKCVLQPIGEKW